MKKLLLLAIIIFVTGCVDNVYNSRGGVIKQHVFSRDYSAVLNQANSYCMSLGMGKPSIKKIWTGRNPILNEKASDEEMRNTRPDQRSGEYDSHEFTCDLPQAVAPSPSKANMSIDQAKDQCKDLGYKPGTEKFGNCVLELSK